MRFKYYLRGLGLGILFTVFVLSVTGNLKTPDKSVNTENNQTETESESEKDSEIPTEEMFGHTETTEIYVPATESATPKTTEAASEVKDKTPSDKTPSDKTSSEESDEDDTYTLVIKRGQVCRDIAESLYKAGIVDDAEKFRKYLGDKGYSHRIRTGSFDIPRDATYDEIIKILAK